MRFVLKAFTALIATAAYSQDGFAGAAAAEALEEEREAFEDFSMSMSMSMPVTTPDVRYNTDIDCFTLQEMWNTDPKSIEGSDLMIIKDYCDQGLLSTAAEVAEAIEAFEGPFNPTIDEQLAIMADQICANAPLETDEEYGEIRNACEEDSRDDEKVVDALARFSVQHFPEEGTVVR